MTRHLSFAAPRRQPITRDQRLTGERDDAATAGWVASRQRVPHNGANRYSHTDGWHVWVQCDHCGTGYALRPDRPRTRLDLADTISAQWITACVVCGHDVALWSGTPWSEPAPLAEAG